jgi:hypothetical protein
MKTEHRDEWLEQRCQAMGDVIADLLPPTRAGAEGRLPESLELAAAGLRPRRRRALLTFIPALAVAAVVVALVTVRARPLRYQLEGAQATLDDWFETPEQGAATVRFSDGTSIAVAQQSAGRIKSCTRVGATFQLERGRASFAVIHRPEADWHVEVGPFEILVTGTKFDVRWSDDHDGFEVVMKSGSTVVRGALAGAGIPLHAGQRLVASLSHQTLVINEIGGEARRPAPPAPASLAEPRDGAARGHRERTGARNHDGARRGVAMADRTTAPAAAWDPARGSTEPAVAPPEPLPEPLPEPARAPPAPAAAPAAPPKPPLLNAGGAACNDPSPPQIRFDRLTEGFSASGGVSSAFSSPVIDHARSWCGGGSLKFDADFNGSVKPSWNGEPSIQSGEAILILPAPVDLTRKTVTVHFYVSGPEDAEFTARIQADVVGKRIGDTYTPNLYPGRWWTISNTFGAKSKVLDFGSSEIEGIRRLILKIDATGTRHVWAGAIYIDDISWR